MSTHGRTWAILAQLVAVTAPLWLCPGAWASVPSRELAASQERFLRQIALRLGYSQRLASVASSSNGHIEHQALIAAWLGSPLAQEDPQTFYFPPVGTWYDADDEGWLGTNAEGDAGLDALLEPRQRANMLRGVRWLREALAEPTAPDPERLERLFAPMLLRLVVVSRGPGKEFRIAMPGGIRLGGWTSDRTPRAAMLPPPVTRPGKLWLDLLAASDRVVADRAAIIDAAEQAIAADHHASATEVARCDQRLRECDRALRASAARYFAALKRARKRGGVRHSQIRQLNSMVVPRPRTSRWPRPRIQLEGSCWSQSSAP